MARPPAGDQRNPLAGPYRGAVAGPAGGVRPPWRPRPRGRGKWATDGTWDRILAEVIVKDDAVGAVEWTFSIDSSSVRAHQSAAGARKRGVLRRVDRRSRRRRRGPRALPRRTDLQAALGRRR